MSLYFIKLYSRFLTNSLIVIILSIEILLLAFNIFIMTTQQLLIKVLEKLYDKRELARSFVVILQESDDEQVVQQFLLLITQLLHQAQQKILDIKDKTQLLQAQKILQQIHIQENKAMDEQEAEDLLATLE